MQSPLILFLKKENVVLDYFTEEDYNTKLFH